MNGVLKPLLVTQDKYLFCTKTSRLEIIKFAMYNIMRAMTKYYRLITSWAKVIYHELTNSKQEHSQKN